MALKKTKMIAKGGFGCVYYPQLLCKGETERGNGVSKVMKFCDAKMELKESLNIDKIDPNFLFHLKTPKLYNIKDIETDCLEECFICVNNVYCCNNGLWHNATTSPPAVLQMPYGGISLYQYYSNIPASTSTIIQSKNAQKYSLICIIYFKVSLNLKNIIILI